MGSEATGHRSDAPLGNLGLGHEVATIGERSTWESPRTSYELYSRGMKKL
jgi:hypothetical protein